jgi:hypothetical protein
VSEGSPRAVRRAAIIRVLQDGTTLIKKLLLLALLAAAAACATTRAQTQPVEHQPMAVPPVPPRVIEAMPAAVPEPLEPVAEMPTAPSIPPRTRPPQRDPVRGTNDPKSEAKPETPPDPATSPPAAAPVPPLRPQGSADGPEMARQVRETLERAKKLLDSIDPRTLSNDRKVNYDTARDFINQAEDAIRQDKLVFAKNLADRAEQVARQLGGR